MDELKNLSNVTIANMKKIDLEEVENKRMLQEIDSRFKDLDRTKATLIASMDKTISETKAKLDNSLEDMQKKVSDMDSRVNRSLQLESKVTEGLLKDAQAKIDKLQLSKEEELSREINKRLSELDAIRMKVKPEEVEKRISQMDHIKATIDDEIKAKLDELTNYNRKQMQTVTDELNIFKEQFIATIGKNVDAFNRAKSEFAEMVKAKDEAVQQKLSLVDAKMKELDEFEKSFADEMGVIIEKAPERKPEKQDLKKKPAKK
jgi:hypothetical protein